MTFVIASELSRFLLATYLIQIALCISVLAGTPFCKSTSIFLPTNQARLCSAAGGHQVRTLRDEIQRSIIPNDEKLIAQLTSRRKLYDSRGRERLESKADLKSRGVESPDRADALIGALMMRLNQDCCAFDPSGAERQHELMQGFLGDQRRTAERLKGEIWGADLPTFTSW
jgi:hypothetical protein